jgi:hypothetical protein
MDSMKRRTLLKLVAAIPLSSLFGSLQNTIAKISKSPKVFQPRVRPSDPKWPNSASWEKLNEQVGGNLIEIHSPFDSYKSDPNSETSKELLKSLQNPYFIGDQPALTQSSGWVDAWTSAPSRYCIAAHKTEDVAAAVNFARENNLRLVVKGGGQSYQGTSSSGFNALSTDRAHIRGKKIGTNNKGF